MDVMIAQLPPEILELICKLCTVRPGFCEFCNLRPWVYGCCEMKACLALRLVNEKFNEASTPFVFGTVRLRIFSPSFERFDAICHSELARHVSRVEFQTDSLPLWDKQTWLSSVDHRPMLSEFRGSYDGTLDIYEAYDKLPRHSLSDEEIEAGWAACETYFQEQQPWRESPAECMTRLEYLLTKLPNLRRARVQGCHSQAGFISPFWQAFYRATHVKSDKWLSATCMEYEDALAIAFLEALGLRNTSTTAKRVEWLIFELATKQGLRILEGETTSGAATDYVPRTQNLMKVFEPLRALKIIMPGVQSSNDLWRVQQLLGAARNLRMLHLVHGYIDEYTFDYEGSELPVFVLMPFFSNPHVTYPHLEEFRIEAPVPAQAFSNFLKLHASTLRRLTLWKSYSDDWAVILCAIAKHLRLEKIYLCGLIDGLCIANAANNWNEGLKPWQRHFIFQTIWPPGGHRSYHITIAPLGFVEAMGKFFDGGGDEGLPQEYYTDERDHDAAYAAQMARAAPTK